MAMFEYRYSNMLEKVAHQAIIKYDFGKFGGIGMANAIVKRMTKGTLIPG